MPNRGMMHHDGEDYNTAVADAVDHAQKRLDDRIKDGRRMSIDGFEQILETANLLQDAIIPWGRGTSM